VWRRAARPPSDSKFPNEKTRRRFSRRGLNSCDDGYKPVICPTSQVSKTELAAARKIQSQLNATSARKALRNNILENKTRGQFGRTNLIVATMGIGR
jgi:hypothetical protein